MSAVKAGALHTVIPDLTSADEAALLVDGFNDMVASLADREKLKTTLSRHVGKKLAGELSAGQVGAGRRVRVTALSLDVDGFTARVSRDAPEQVVAFVQEVVAACIAVVEEHEGHVANVLGDSLLALWGVPNESPDDAARAVAAALALQHKCKAISDARVARRDEGFSVTLGVATGDAVLATVGNDERAESVVVGEPTTLARRIEEQAKSTNFGLLLSEETWRALPDDKRYEGAATPLVLIRGWGVPLTLYRVRERRVSR
jgi:adenylate cyclase